MPRLTVSLDDDQDDWLEAEADRRDRSKAHVMRQLIDAHRTGEVSTDAHHPADDVADLRERVSTLEDRLAELESADDVDAEPQAPTAPTPDATREAGAGVSDASPTPDEEPHSVPSDAETSDRVRAAVDAVAEGWADSGDRLEARKAAARAVLEYALEDGAVGKSEEGRELHDKHPVMGQNFDTWWRKNVRPVLNEYGEYSQGAHGYVVEEIEP
jgi:hypothetical protein